MAAPADMTAGNMSGKFILNKAQSEKNDEILKNQGVGWVTRKAATHATPHLAVKHYKDASGVEHVEVEQAVAGSTVSEHRVLDSSEKAIDSPLVGPLVQRNRRVAAGELGVDWLKEGWLAESFVDGGIIHVTADSDAGKSDGTWHMEQLVGGQKKYVRRIHCVGQKGEVVHGCMVYDYEGPL
uniref:Non-specific serine/threonine protein kinase (EC) n=1 Tax=Ganoderma boninense TaxID=34458 RepID=A0A5K1K2Z0_9APHY|nr:Non-specific serine/threonine protein kinase (EC [Ganoderma boninense]